MNTPKGAATLRYLRYDEKVPVHAGMDHQLMNLECLLREAHAAGRLALLPALRLLPRHNFGVQHHWQWDRYFDLDRSRLLDTEGTEHPLPVVRHLPQVDAPTFRLAPGQRRPDAARGHVLVVRPIAHYNFYRNVPEEDTAPLRLRMRHSRRVRELARLVLSDLLARGGTGFVAVHARRGDRVGQYPSRLTEPPAILSCLRGRGVPDGSVVFLMSDERNPSFWEPLHQHYDLVRYTQYPELAALVTCRDDHRPDNYLLYAVEKEIMSHAGVRIETRPDVPNADVHGSLVDEVTWSRFLRRRDNPFLRSLRKLRPLGRRAGGRLRRLCTTAFLWRIDAGPPADEQGRRRPIRERR